jgi:hypothetical protein
LSCLFSNAVLVSESHLAKSGVKQAGAAPPATPMEKYKLRISVGKLTGRLDLACKAVWPAEEGGTRTQSVAHTRENSHVIAKAESATTLASETGGDGDAVFLTQDPETDSAELEGKSEEENLEGIFDQVADSRSGNAAEEAALAEALETGSAAGSTASAQTKTKPKEMMLDFRLSVIPKEVLRINGKVSCFPLCSAATVFHNKHSVSHYFAELTELWLCNNVISALPPGIGELKQLTTLSLTGNKLEVLAPELCQLVNLRRLYARGNKLTSLPNLMGQMQSLQYIDCADNQFSTFPEVLTSMHRLVHLNFSKNMIAAIPASLEPLQCLIYLNLSENSVTKTQPVLLRMPWLDVLGVPLSAENRGSRTYQVSLSEEHELTNLLKSRAAASLTAKLRRKKKKSSYM